MKYLLIVMVAISFLHAGFLNDLGIQKKDNIEKAKKLYPYYNELPDLSTLYVQNCKIGKYEVKSMSIQYKDTVIEKTVIFVKYEHNRQFVDLYNDIYKSLGKPCDLFKASLVWITKQYRFEISIFEEKSIIISME